MCQVGFAKRNSSQLARVAMSKVRYLVSVVTSIGLISLYGENCTTRISLMKFGFERSDVGGFIYMRDLT